MDKSFEDFYFLWSVSCYICQRRNEASYIRSKFTGTQVKMENGALEKGDNEPFNINSQLSDLGLCWTEWPSLM